jgi:predicted RNase H-like HicB family nuclease
LPATAAWRIFSITFAISSEASGAWYNHIMRTFTAVIERDPDTGLLVGYVPGFPGAHSQGATSEELARNLREVIAMLLEDGEPALDGEFVGTQLVNVD